MNFLIRTLPLLLPTFWVLSDASPVQGQMTVSPLPRSSVTKIAPPKATPTMTEMRVKDNETMSLRAPGLPNVLRQDDIISISVIGHPDFSLPEVAVSSAGQISHPLAGLVKVSGMTLGQAALAIKKSLAVYMKKPVVTVGLVRARVHQVFVTGAVKAPGIISIGDGWRVSEAISAVGGLSRRPEMTGLSLTRIGKSTKKIDLPAILRSPTSAANIELRPGDSLRFDEQSVQVSIVGQVRNPGSLELSVGSRLFDAILAAGGTLPRAALSKATLKRADGTTLPVNLLQTESDTALESNPVLLTGDFLSVPEQQARITILGAVAKPGSVDMPEGKTLRVTDALAAAGGPIIAPRAARISIARYLPGGRLVPINIDASALLVEGDLSQNATLREDDLITISALKVRTIFVTGQVNKPGPIDADAAEGLTQILARAGGSTSNAALRKVTVTRDGALVNTVDLLSAVAGGAVPDVQLQDGDYINVPRNEARVMVLPAVRNPGVYTIPEDRPLTVGDALALAGGPQSGAKLKEVVIFRETPKGVTSQLVSLTPKPGATLPTNIVLQDKDFLYVPEADRNRVNYFDTGLRAFQAFSFLLR